MQKIKKVWVKCQVNHFLGGSLEWFRVGVADTGSI